MLRVRLLGAVLAIGSLSSVALMAVDVAAQAPAADGDDVALGANAAGDPVGAGAADAGDLDTVSGVDTREVPAAEPDALLAPEADAPGMSSGISEMIWPFMKSMIMLAVVVGLAYLTLHKGLGKLMVRTQMGKRMKVLERVSLDQRRSLYLVEIDGHEIVLGGGEGGVVHLANLNGDVRPPTAEERGKAFKSILQTPRADTPLRDDEKKS